MLLALINPPTFDQHVVLAGTSYLSLTVADQDSCWCGRHTEVEQGIVGKQRGCRIDKEVKEKFA